MIRVYHLVNPKMNRFLKLILMVFWHCRAMSLNFLKEKILHNILVSPSLSFQVRPEIQIPDDLDEDEEGDEKDVDLSIPGSCYLKLLSLTAPSVLPGDSYFVSGKLAFF